MNVSEMSFYFQLTGNWHSISPMMQRLKKSDHGAIQVRRRDLDDRNYNMLEKQRFDFWLSVHTIEQFCISAFMAEHYVALSLWEWL